jgi:leucine dehydrogenase
VIAIQGLGNVGTLLAELLFWHGAKLKIADIDQEKAQKIAQKTGATIEDPADILRTECDILSPCAMGAIFNDKTILELKCKGIAGSANNMLTSEYHGQMLQNQGILYAPDFIANAGGAINVAHELEEKMYNPLKARQHIDEMYDLLLQIFEMAKSKNISTAKAALTITDYKLKNKVGARLQPPHFHH